MNRIVLKQIIILSILFGAVLGLLTIIPFIGFFAFLILMFFGSMILMWFMTKVELLYLSEMKESIIIGAIIGFVSFLGFSVIYLPLVAILGRVFKLYMQYGISLFLGVGSFGVILMLIIFMAILCATVNAFGGFIAYYGLEFLKSLVKSEQPKIDLQNSQQIQKPFNGGNNDFKL